MTMGCDLRGKDDRARSRLVLAFVAVLGLSSMAAAQSRPSAPCPPSDPRSKAEKVSDFGLHVERNVDGFFTPPYKDASLIYGYYDYVDGRGPRITLGSRNLQPGFRGFGLLFSPGYGAGNWPTSAIDLNHINGGPWYHRFPKPWKPRPPSKLMYPWPNDLMAVPRGSSPLPN
jgi:hypothetical protein